MQYAMYGLQSEGCGFNSNYGQDFFFHFSILVYFEFPEAPLSQYKWNQPPATKSMAYDKGMPNMNSLSIFVLWKSYSQCSFFVSQRDRQTDRQIGPTLDFTEFQPRV